MYEELLLLLVPAPHFSCLERKPSMLRYRIAACRTRKSASSKSRRRNNAQTGERAIHPCEIPQLRLVRIATRERPGMTPSTNCPRSFCGLFLLKFRK